MQGIDEVCIFHERSDAKKINKDSDAVKITNNLTNSFFNNYHEMLSDKPKLVFDTIVQSGIHVNIINYKCHCGNLK